MLREADTQLRLYIEHNYGQRIILNVGGIQYETYRETLTAYPYTLLGQMFAQYGKSFLDPVRDTEYFIDRNSLAFYYVLHFYRTGNIFWLSISKEDWTLPLTREELVAEFNYFLIPLVNVGPGLPRKIMSARVDQFVAALRQVIYHIASNYCLDVSIRFKENRHDYQAMAYIPSLPKMSDQTCVSIYDETEDEPGLREQEKSKSDLDQLLTEIMRPFRLSGYDLLDRYGEEIVKLLRIHVSDLAMELQCDREWRGVYMYFTETYDKDDIIRDSCLSTTNFTENELSLVLNQSSQYPIEGEIFAPIQGIDGDLARQYAPLGETDGLAQQFSPIDGLVQHYSKIGQCGTPQQYTKDYPYGSLYRKNLESGLTKSSSIQQTSVSLSRPTRPLSIQQQINSLLASTEVDEFSSLGTQPYTTGGLAEPGQQCNFEDFFTGSMGVTTQHQLV